MDGSFKETDDDCIISSLPPPYNCSVCQLTAFTEGQARSSIRDGIIHMGNVYHQNDYVLLSNPGGGPANIGRIVVIQQASEVPEVTVVLLDRVAKLPLPSHITYIDEVSDILASLTYTDHTNSEGTLPHRQV